MAMHCQQTRSQVSARASRVPLPSVPGSLPCSDPPGGNATHHSSTRSTTATSPVVVVVVVGRPKLEASIQSEAKFKTPRELTEGGTGRAAMSMSMSMWRRRPGMCRLGFASDFPGASWGRNRRGHPAPPLTSIEKQTTDDDPAAVVPSPCGLRPACRWPT
ncbi:hypothetical protein BS78_10G218100 [Paspalum vaginatum]|nr:hypothetical protein BS78_10G218100 [Paspalum vaginatum]